MSLQEPSMASKTEDCRSPLENENLQDRNSVPKNVSSNGSGERKIRGVAELPDTDNNDDDLISLSTSSISTTPTPEYQLYSGTVSSGKSKLSSISLEIEAAASKSTASEALTNEVVKCRTVLSSAATKAMATKSNISSQQGSQTVKRTSSSNNMLMLSDLVSNDANVNNESGINHQASAKSSKCRIAKTSDVTSFGMVGGKSANGADTFVLTDRNDSKLHEDFHKSPEPIILKPERTILSADKLVTTKEGKQRGSNETAYQSYEDNCEFKTSVGTHPVIETSNMQKFSDEHDGEIKAKHIISNNNACNKKSISSSTTTDYDPLLRGSNSFPTLSSSTSENSMLPPKLPTSRIGNTVEVTSIDFSPQYKCTKIAYWLSKRIFDDANDDFAVSTWLGFWAYFNVTCANYVLKPITDAVVLQLGVQYLPQLSLASSVLAFLSSVPIGWLFEAPDPSRRKVFRKMGMTRGETQGTSLALFYRFFAMSALSYAIGFQLVDAIQNYGIVNWVFGDEKAIETTVIKSLWKAIPFLLKKWGQFMYVAFFLVIHLMKLHSVSLIWGVTTEAMEYEDVARKQHELDNPTSVSKKKKTRLQRLARIQFGGTLGGIWGSVLASSLAKIFHLPGLLVVSCYLLEVSAELSIELGRIMQKHWEEQQIFKSNQDLAGLDPSMKRSSSFGSMKRVSSGNSVHSMKRVASGNLALRNSPDESSPAKFLVSKQEQNDSDAVKRRSAWNHTAVVTPTSAGVIDDNTFTQRLLRGVTTILKSRLLMTIFTYNALFASTTVLLSFQRAELVANRKSTTTVSADTAYLANINIASSIAVFAMQSSRLGAFVTQKFGTRGSLALMPFIRLVGLVCLCWWHRSTNGQPPNLILFLVLDELTRVINLAVAKPVRESLWSDLNNEARYEAKPIIDVLANRWGAGSASFCVSIVSRVMLFFGQTIGTTTFINDRGDPIVLGLPPVLFLGMIASAWWLGVSLDLGQLRARIDLELRKRQ